MIPFSPISFSIFEEVLRTMYIKIIFIIIAITILIVANSALKERIDVDTQRLGEPPERSGFTLVEWGGLFEGEEKPLFNRIFEILKAFLRQVKFKITK